MDLKQALDFLASNCPTVFQPISNELEGLRKENDSLKDKVDLTQNALNELIFNVMSGGN
ncbi:Uncharacterised protein [uncultured Clostridium sp.]|nr:Uncharacterised protein [uncultured Clostridium sp.]SCI95236.1 Uncharacterised protein [uncultured Clostridium sp.]